ncbi:MAG: DNA (cytosine-5-)-methyltransferase [Paludibacteraceae bacterium]|nr:DNA (cytosine-5-)-methyltransferase [Paludibacteraceae bacterium]
MNNFFTITNLADILGVSFRTVNSWIDTGKLRAETDTKGRVGFTYFQLMGIPEIDEMVNSDWDKELQIKPLRQYNSIELFAGGGGLALGMEKAGFHHIMLNEFDHSACETLRTNRPKWNIVEGDIHNIDFTPYKGQVDFISGGFPCQAFSYAGEKKGFEDARGTLFFELARAVKETQPKVFLGENVRGLFTHENGKTLQVIKDVIADLGYTLIEPRVLKAIMYQVPQKRERLILIAIRNDIADKVTFNWPAPYNRILNLRDAFYKGILYNSDVPDSIGQNYPQRKKEIMDMVPMGGNWTNLPLEIQKEYLKGSFGLEGGKTGIARRLSLDEPSLTLTCSPAMKQTERCHPLETRPLNIREYARIQTFPDEWQFMGKMDAQYKQIGNAVPVNLAYAIGRSLIRLFNDIELLNK